MKLSASVSMRNLTSYKQLQNILSTSIGSQHSCSPTSYLFSVVFHSLLSQWHESQSLFSSSCCKIAPHPCLQGSSPRTMYWALLLTCNVLNIRVLHRASLKIAKALFSSDFNWNLTSFHRIQNRRPESIAYLVIYIPQYVQSCKNAQHFVRSMHQGHDHPMSVIDAYGHLPASLLVNFTIFTSFKYWQNFFCELVAPALTRLVSMLLSFWRCSITHLRTPASHCTSPTRSWLFGLFTRTSVTIISAIDHW